MALHAFKSPAATHSSPQHPYLRGIFTDLAGPLSVLGFIVAVLAWRASRRQARGPDHVFLVASLSHETLPVRISPDTLRVNLEQDQPLKVVLENAGAGPATEVDVRIELVVPQSIEAIVDALDPVAIAHHGATRLGLMGAPGSVSVGVLANGALALGYQTYELAVERRRSHSMLASGARLEIDLPFELTRALAIYAIAAGGSCGICAETRGLPFGVNGARRGLGFCLDGRGPSGHAVELGGLNVRMLKG